MPLLHPDRPAHSLTPGEVKRLTMLFIGVDGGYLGDFTRGELDSFFLHLRSRPMSTNSKALLGSDSST